MTSIQNKADECKYECPFNTERLSFEKKYIVYQRHLKRINDRISGYQKILENKELRIPNEYRLRGKSVYKDAVRERIEYFTDMRDDLINCWNKFNASRVASCLE